MEVKLREITLFAYAVVLMAMCGCSSAPPQYQVVGKVVYQGRDVAEGQIIFAAADGHASTAVGRIENGRYIILTTAGEKNVRITASKETGRMIEGAMDQKYSEVIDLIPPKYNSRSTLSYKVDPNSDLTYDFVLK